MQLEGIQTPQVSVEKRGPREISVGKPVRYEIIVRNIGSATAHDVVLRDAAPVTHNFSVFIDTRADAPPAERWKAIGGTRESGLIRYVSTDGVTWRKFADGAPMLPPVKAYRYDSQNLAFWSEAERRYVCYFRTFVDVPGRTTKVRWVARASSPDFRTWTEEGDMTFRAADGTAAEPEHL